ncbi:MAG: hypothetical protein VKN72_27505 [Nostocales cyanobacterium 94392]|nr:hypothetical protein [Nostocales cyanobacterium 94392]
MTSEQQNIADDFMGMVEKEYALCVQEMNKANIAAMSGNSSDNSNEKLSINYACLEIDAIREYWFNRLVSLMQIIEKRNSLWSKELRNKYLIR